MNYEISSFDLKLALLQYYRFKRQCVCISEFLNADIVADSGKEILEIEIKISIYDLLNGEKRKIRKHKNYANGIAWCRLKPNRFLFCVPIELMDAALEYIQELNPNYGLIVFNADRFYENLKNDRVWQHCDYLHIAKSAKKLHNDYKPHKWEMAKRASSEIARSMHDHFTRTLNDKLARSS